MPRDIVVENERGGTFSVREDGADWYIRALSPESFARESAISHAKMAKTRAVQDCPPEPEGTDGRMSGEELPVSRVRVILYEP